jgi:hypothetical protein
MQFDRLRRREFITLLGGATAWPLAARAQQTPRGARLGYLAPASNPDLQQVLLGGLRDLGYVEGQNLAIEYRFMLGQSKTYDELAAELAASLPTPSSSSGHHRHSQQNGKLPSFPSSWPPRPILCALALLQAFLVLGAM